MEVSGRNVQASRRTGANAAASAAASALAGREVVELRGERLVIPEEDTKTADEDKPTSHQEPHEKQA